MTQKLQVRKLRWSDLADTATYICTFLLVVGVIMVFLSAMIPSLFSGFLRIGLALALAGGIFFMALMLKSGERYE